MKAAFIDKPGPAESIRYADLPTPNPGSGEVRVRVAAVAVNPIDTYIRSGAVAVNLPLPFVVGCDLAGTVDAVGSGVERFKSGDRVWGSNQGLLGRQGTFAEFACVDSDWLYSLPSSVSFVDAAACVLVGITAHLGLFHRAALKAGETLFVRGGSGGVGSMVTQMAKAAGARVLTTAGSEAKAAKCRVNGADDVILYKSANLTEALKTLAQTDVDVWWETLREPDFDLAVSHLKMGGRMVLMAGRAARPEFPVGPFYTKNCALHGFAMFNAPPERQRECATDINRWFTEGKLRANIARTMPLAETAAAHQLQEDNTLKMAGTLDGKIVLIP